MKRTLPPLRLAGSPLVLVLCQVRIAAVRDMASYTPALQDRLRRDGFPVDVSKEVLDLSLQAQGPATERRRAHWEFRSLDEDRSIIVGDGAVVVQTTAYDCFESFLTTLSFAMAAVDAAVGDLVVERVGLRYVDFIDPRPGESWKDYVAKGNACRGFPTWFERLNGGRGALPGPLTPDWDSTCFIAILGAIRTRSAHADPVFGGLRSSPAR